MKPNEVPVAEFVAEEITGVVADPVKRAAARAARTTALGADASVADLYKKHDLVVADLSAIKASVARIEGKLDVVPTLVALLEKVVVGEVAGDTATLTAKLEIGKAAAADQLKDNEVKRKFLDGLATKALAGLAAIGALIGAYLVGRS